jgi:hypothetical protein
MNDVLDWRWIAASAAVPIASALAAAWPFWRRSSRDPIGSVAGAFVAFVFALAFVGRESIHVQRLTQHCLTLEVPCRFVPEPYERFFLYIGIAMVQAALIFMVGARVENKRQESAVAPEWRR